MKTGKLLGMLLFVLGTFSLMGCNDEMTDEEEGWYDSIPDGNFFSRGNTDRKSTRLNSSHPSSSRMPSSA